MKVSLNWLTDYVDVSMPAEELGRLLTGLGMNCEEIISTPTDVVFDLEITSNRPDELGYLGVAREIAAATGAALGPPAIADLPASGNAADFTSVEVLSPDLCPRYTARVIRGVTVGPSPRWLIERLEAIGLRSINNVVDVTNYVLFEYSQPLHCFDHDKLAEGRIVVRRGLGGEQIVSIDGTRCTLDESMLVIADASRPVAVAGIMGGLDTEVNDSTMNVLIESARFDPYTIRRTSRKLRLMTESNYRFERGVDPVGVERASLRACQLLLQLAGGELAEGVVDVWAQPYEPPVVSLRPGRCCALLGFDVPPARQAAILDRLGLRARTEGGRIVCAIPPHRADLRREADLIEEVARLVGYDEVPVHGQVAHAVVAEVPIERLRRAVGAALTAAGFDEAITFTFVDADEAAPFGVADPVCVDAAARRTNNALRPTIVPSLLRACKVNQDAGTSDVSLFELAAVFPPGRQGGVLADEHTELALVTTRSLRELRGAMESVVAAAAPDAAFDVRQADVPGLAAGAAAEVLLDASPAGWLGCVAAEVLDRYGLEARAGEIAAGVMRFEALAQRYQRTRSYRPIAKFPPVRRDLSVVVDEAVTWRQLLAAVGAVDQALRVEVAYVTTYRGRPIPAGRKSVTLRLTYRSDAGTLRREEVDAQVEQVLAALRKGLAAELRS